MDVDTVGGEPGVWRRLVVTNTDGSSPQILFEHFIEDSDVAQHLTALGIDPEDPFEVECLRSWVGPRKVQWSPAGDRVAFNVAYPFDALGLPYGHQIEVWIYDLTTADLTRITDSTDEESYLSWKGDNTSPDDPSVTVDNTTVTFSQVVSEGLTTILREDDGPSTPVGYHFCEEFYEISTTADFSGLISICMTYDDEDVPTGVAEEDLALLRYVEDGDYWEDITVSVDTEANLVCGETEALSLFSLLPPHLPRFPDVPTTGYGPGGTDPHWAYFYVEASAEAGIVAGYPDGLYRPARDVGRDGMAIYIARALAGGADAIPDGPASVTFADVGPGHWAFDAVEYAAAAGVVVGFADGSYQPTWNVTRSQMAVYVARARGWVEIGEDMATAGDLFADVPAGYWSGAAIEACVANDVVQGYGDGLYRPTATVTRDQMAVYVARAFDLPL